MREARTIEFSPERGLVLAGNFLGRNFGDDLMLSGHLMSIECPSPTILCQAVVSQPDWTVDGVRLLNWRSIEALRSIATAHTFTQVGGTHLQYLKTHPRWNQYKVLLGWFANFYWARLFRTNVRLVAVGLGPFDTRMSALVARIALKATNFVSVRDQDSLETSRSLGVDSSLVEDLGLVHLRESLRQRSVGGSPIGPPTILLAPAFTNFDRDWWRREVLFALRQFPDLEVTILESGQQSHGSDVEVADWLAKIISERDPHRKIKRLVYRGDLEFVINDVVRASHIVAARYHIVLLARAAGIPVSANAYHPKIRSALRQEPISKGRAESPGG